MAHPYADAFSIGISIASVTHLPPDRLFEAIADIATAVDDAGADLLAVPDHVMQMGIGGGPDQPMLEAYTLLGALAARTARTRLAAFVTPATLRHPPMLAKMVTTLDVVSGGRAVLGVGAGVDAAEHRAYGLDFPDVRTRMRRLDETLDVCATMFRQPLTTFAGEQVTLTDARNIPAPRQRRLPILVGGGGERYTLPLVARYADVCNLPPADDGQLTARLERVDRLLDEAGRDQADLHRTAFLREPESPDALAARAVALRTLGFQGVIIAAAHATPAAVHDWTKAVRAELG